MRVVVLTGAGEEAFSAGADLSGMAGGAGHLELHEARGELGRFINDIWYARASRPSPRSGALPGRAASGWRCRATSSWPPTDAVFGTPEINVGLWPMMITVPLLRAMPPKKALELMMTGRRVSAEPRASGWGS